jgi:hypothetical protein
LIATSDSILSLALSLNIMLLMNPLVSELMFYLHSLGPKRYRSCFLAIRCFKASSSWRRSSCDSWIGNGDFDA